MINQKQIMISTWDHQPVSISFRLCRTKCRMPHLIHWWKKHGSSGWPKASMLRYCALPARDRDRSEAIIIDGEARRKRPSELARSQEKPVQFRNAMSTADVSPWLTNYSNYSFLMFYLEISDVICYWNGTSRVYLSEVGITCWFLLWTCLQETIHGNLNSGVRQVIVWTTKWVICTCKLPHSVVHRKLKHFSLVNILYSITSTFGS